MEEFVTNVKANYYSGITSIMVNGKRVYELKGKILDDLRDNTFNGTNGEDVNNGQEGVADKEFSDAKKANNDDEQETAEIFRMETNLFEYETPLCTEFKEFNFLLKVDPELFTHDIKRTKTYKDYENELNNELEEPWSEVGVPYEIYDHICEPFHFKNGKAKWPTYNLNEDGFCNGGELPRMVRRFFGNFHELDYELLIKLQDYWWNVNDHEGSPFSNWRNHIQGPYENYYNNFLDNEEHENKDKHGLFDNQKRAVCNIRRFEMIKYSFGKDKEYVAIKEHEYNDLMSTNDDACRTYQEIFHKMDEGWMVTRAE
ncbi:hypothetical protein Tco_0397703 [Tanacetum coccineum]